MSNVVAAIMPTRNRPDFVALAIEYFLRQTYKDATLVIMDNSDNEQTAAVVAPYLKQQNPLGGTKGIAYYRLGSERLKIGALRNRAIEAVQDDAVIIIHWDDDDWHSPERIEKQVTALLKAAERGVMMNGMSSGLFWWPFSPEREAYRYNYGNRSYVNSNPYIMGATMCYFVRAWQGNRFRDIDMAEDNFFLKGFLEGQVEALPLPDSYVVIRHSRNTDYNTTPEQAQRSKIWECCSYEDVRFVMGSDVDRYQPQKAEAEMSKTTQRVKLSHDWSRHRQGEPSPRAGAIVEVTEEELALLRSQKHRSDTVVTDVFIGEAIPNTKAVSLSHEDVEDDGA